MCQFSSQLKGTHVLVTGGSKGLGKAMVEGYLAEGANASYCARTVTGDEFSDFHGATHGARAIGTSVDISDPEAIKVWVEESAAEFGKIDVVIANAHPFFRQPTLEDWQKSFQADVLGLLTLIQATTPHLAKQGSGSIIVMSSLAGFELKLPEIGTPYATLKRAQATMAKDYARQLAPQGIRINTVVPGFIDKPAGEGASQHTAMQKAALTNPERISKFLDTIPLGRAGSAEDAANLAIFLGSHLSKYITGAVIHLDGGMSTAL